MSLAAALCEVAGRRFGLWDSVVRRASTAADRATGMAGDLECRDGGRLAYVVEVKERQVALADVLAFEDKLVRSGATEALISTPGVNPLEGDEIERRIRLMWARGINLYRFSIEEIVSVTMALAGEEGRRDFIAEIGRQLDEYARPSGRAAWRDLLAGVLDGAGRPDA